VPGGTVKRRQTRPNTDRRLVNRTGQPSRHPLKSAERSPVSGDNQASEHGLWIANDTIGCPATTLKLRDGNPSWTTHAPTAQQIWTATKQYPIWPQTRERQNRRTPAFATSRSVNNHKQNRRADVSHRRDGRNIRGSPSRNAWPAVEHRDNLAGLRQQSQQTAPNYSRVRFAPASEMPTAQPPRKTRSRRQRESRHGTPRSRTGKERRGPVQPS